MNGKFTAIVESRRKITVATIYVTKETGGCLLSGSTAEELGLISFHLNAVETTKTSPTALHTPLWPQRNTEVEAFMNYRWVKLFERRILKDGHGNKSSPSSYWRIDLHPIRQQRCRLLH